MTNPSLSGRGRALQRSQPRLRRVAEPMPGSREHLLPRPAESRVIDIGSNSLRLVVYDGSARAPLPLLNEKVMCGLGRGSRRTGAAQPRGRRARAAPICSASSPWRARSASRSSTCSRRRRCATPATASLRRRDRAPRCGVAGARSSTGAEEARLSAAGVLPGIPDADGVVGDLGGGSVELVRIGRSSPGVSRRRGDRGRSADGRASPCRWAAAPRRARRRRAKPCRDDRRSSPRCRCCASATGRSLYLVGGAWRAHRAAAHGAAHYPLHIIHHTPCRAARPRILRARRPPVAQIAGADQHDLAQAPRGRCRSPRCAAPADRASEPKRVVFSASGLREGYAYGLLPAAEQRIDPLIAACMAMRRASRAAFRLDGERLSTGRRRSSPSCRAVAAPAPRRRLAQRHRLDRASRLPRRAGLQPQPTMPVGGIDHPERVFIASALHARYGGAADDPIIGADPSCFDERRRCRGARHRPGAAARLHALRRRARAAGRARLGRDGRHPRPRPAADRSLFAARRSSAASTRWAARSARRATMRQRRLARDSRARLARMRSGGVTASILAERPVEDALCAASPSAKPTSLMRLPRR